MFKYILSIMEEIGNVNRTYSAWEARWTVTKGEDVRCPQWNFLCGAQQLRLAHAAVRLVDPAAMIVARSFLAGKGTSWCTTGLLLKVVVYVANIQDREGIPFLLAQIKRVFPRLNKVWVDQGYTSKGREWIQQEMGSRSH